MKKIKFNELKDFIRIKYSEEFAKFDEKGRDVMRKKVEKIRDDYYLYNNTWEEIDSSSKEIYKYKENVIEYDYTSQLKNAMLAMLKEKEGAERLNAVVEESAKAARLEKERKIEAAKKERSELMARLALDDDDDD